MQLVVDHFGVFHLALVLVDQLALYLFVKGLHLHAIQLLPVSVHLPFVVGLSVLEGELHLSFGLYIRHEQLGLEGFDLILLVVGVLVGSLNHSHSLLELELVLQRVNAATVHFLLLESGIALVFPLLSYRMHRVRPLCNACFRFFLEILPLSLPLLVIIKVRSGISMCEGRPEAILSALLADAC